MAACQGYKCEFLDSVPDDLYCKKCTLVARKLSITDCCGESFCKACIVSIQDNEEPCPECGVAEFTTFEHIKSQKRINNLQVYCSMKERGCGWSGTLQQLDTHLDPHQDNCQYVDTKCPLHCLKTIPKNNLDDHLAQHCVKRAYVCRHCSFEATYEEVVDTHLPQCKYVPLDCPNRCGATFERDFLEDHMKMCRLEEVECELRSVGCGGRFLREDQEEHARENSQKHLTLTASLAVETKEQFQQKLLELDQRHKEEEEKLKKIEEDEKKLGEQEETSQEQEERCEEHEKKIRELEKKLREQEKQLGNQEKKLGEQEKKLGEQEETSQEQEERCEEHEKKIRELEKKLREQEKQLGNQEKKLGEQEKKLGEQEKKLGEHNKTSRLEKRFKVELERELQELKKTFQEFEQKISTTIYLHRRFEMRNFSAEKEKDISSDWKSPAMYTHVGGYKFCIGVDANGYDDGHGRSIFVDLWALPGEFDDQLKWPARAKFTIELISQRGRPTLRCNRQVLWNKFAYSEQIESFDRLEYGFLDHSRLSSYLKQDSLVFNVYDVKLL